MKRIVLKIGTQVIIDPSGMALKNDFLDVFVELVGRLHRQGMEVVVVSSGAVALGRGVLGLTGEIDLRQRQACAAIGQARLMHAYDQRLQHQQMSCAQILLTGEDLASRRTYLHLKETFSTLLAWGVVPIVNENDSVSTAELEVYAGKSFGDNDVLSALIASKLQADLMILLTSVDGIYREAPRAGQSGERLRLVEDVHQLSQVIVSEGTSLGRGGMASKLEAVRLAALCGVSVWVGQLADLVALSEPWQLTEGSLASAGTLVAPQKVLRGRKKWIGGSAGYRGVITINAGARVAVVEKRASLLAIGIVDSQGQFVAGEIVSVHDEQGREIARGLVRLGASELNAVIQHYQENDSPTRAASPAKTKTAVVIHRDDLAVFVKE